MAIQPQTDPNPEVFNLISDVSDFIVIEDNSRTLLESILVAQIQEKGLDPECIPEVFSILGSMRVSVVKDNVEFSDINEKIDEIITVDPSIQAESGNTGGSESREVIHQYLKAIKDYPLLSLEEERELAIRIADGDAEARETLINHNLRLVVSVAKRYSVSSGGMSFPDLIQEGNIGLIRAVAKFDPGRPTKFSTMAVPWIRQAINRAINDKSRMIRVPVHTGEHILKLAKCENAMKAQGMSPSNEELSLATGLSVARVEQIKSAPKDPLSLDMHYEGDGANMTLAEIVPDFSPEICQSLESDEFKQAVNDGLETLKPREEAVFRSLYGFKYDCFVEPKTLDEVGTEYGVTRERVRQIREKARAKVATYLAERGFSIDYFS